MKNGFTLIELLVVVAIIGMLSSVVLASLNTARGNARDARRQQDLKQIQVALELYYNVNNAYPGEVACDTSKGSGTGNCAGYTGTDWDEDSYIHAALVPDYIPDLPKDPLNNVSYYYNYEPVGGNPRDNYCLGAALESGGRFQLKEGAQLGNC